MWTRNLSEGSWCEKTCRTSVFSQAEGVQSNFSIGSSQPPALRAKSMLIIRVHGNAPTSPSNLQSHPLLSKPHTSTMTQSKQMGLHNRLPRSLRFLVVPLSMNLHLHSFNSVTFSTPTNLKPPQLTNKQRTQILTYNMNDRSRKLVANSHTSAIKNTT